LIQQQRIEMNSTKAGDVIYYGGL